MDGKYVPVEMETHLLERLQDLLLVVLLGHTLERGEGLAAITLLDTDMDVVGLGADVILVVRERIALLGERICGALSASKFQLACMRPFDPRHPSLRSATTAESAHHKSASSTPTSPQNQLIPPITTPSDLLIDNESAHSPKLLRFCTLMRRVEVLEGGWRGTRASAVGDGGGERQRTRAALMRRAGCAIT